MFDGQGIGRDREVALSAVQKAPGRDQTVMPASGAVINLH